MKRSIFLSILLVIVTIMVGCAHYSLVDSREKFLVGKGILVKTNIAWNVAKENGLIIWTIDGPGLQKLLFFTGIKDGKPLFKPKPGQDSEKVPMFRNTMTSLEIVDLIEASLSRQNVHQFEKKNLQPKNIGGEEGFQFDFSYFSEQGLEYEGLAAGTIKNNQLYLFLYTGVALHYFEKYISEVDYILQSIEFL
jgi:hypothetical protein